MQPYGSILDMIGNTPLVPIRRLNQNKQVQVLTKLEGCNPSGSVKARPALYMIEEAEKNGELTKDKIVLEATSGNTGIGLALVCAVKGYRLMLAMSESASEERKTVLRAYGAKLVLTPSSLGTDGAIEYVYNLSRRQPDKYFLVDQFNNPANWLAHYHTTALEIWEQTEHKVSVVVIGLGTSGTFMGVCKRLKELNPGIRMIALEPAPGHRIQGLKNMTASYKPEIYDERCADEILPIGDEESFEMARRLAQQEGLFVGMSSGAAVAGALRVAHNMPEGVVVTILPDFGDRYVSTSLFTAVQEDEQKVGPYAYNTVTRKKDPLVPFEQDGIKMYTCGPTVDSYMHLGLCRRFVTADVVRRYLESKGKTVKQVVNITDLDDRTIQTAEQEGMPVEELTTRYLDAFREDSDSLLIKRASVYPRVSEHIDEMIALTQQLLDAGIAYEKHRSVYFDITRYRAYGKFSGIDLNKIKIGATVNVDQYDKNHPSDFTLFKRSTLGELKRGVFFKTNWGNGRPGWHLECPAISMKYLGETFDIHTGDANLIFPHHENEIAIAESLTGKPLCRFWIHNAPVMLNGRMMSERSGEVVTLRELLQKGYTGRQIRYFLLTCHYRTPLNYSQKSLDAFCKALQRLDTFFSKLLHYEAGAKDQHIDPIMTEMETKFESAMDDDLNTPKSLAAIFEMIKKVYPLLESGELGKNETARLLAALRGIDQVLGILDEQ